METQSLIAAALATLFAGSAFANTHVQDAATSMTVDSAAPIRAILLPSVSIYATPATSDANPATMRIANTAPIEVTLLPTVHVTARANPELAITLLPTIRVTPTSSAALESMEVAEADNVVGDLPVIDDETISTDSQPIGLRARTMPR